MPETLLGDDVIVSSGASQVVSMQVIPKRSVYILFGSSINARTASSARIRNYRNNFDKKKYQVEVRSLQDYKLFKRFELAFKDVLVARFFLEFVFSVLIALKILIESNRDAIVLVSSPPFFLTLSGLIISKFSNRLVVYDIRDLYPHVFLWKGVLSGSSPVYKLMFKLASAAYRDKICICATKGINRYVELDFLCQCACLYLNGSSLPRADSRLDKLKNERTFTVIIHGTLGRLQNQDYLYKLMENCPKVKFKIFTDRQRLNVQKFDVLNNVIISDRISPDKLGAEIRKSHLLISLRDESNLTALANPVKVFDSLSQGTPSIIMPHSEILSHVGSSTLLKAFNYDEFSGLVAFVNRCQQDFGFYRSSFPEFGFGCGDVERPQKLPEAVIEALK
ncbi:hypothetical protein N9I56_04955 [Alphaproteobacteria bacterium]|nr:hypothetical protein [Alphaproteobacteria bacterium]